MNLKVIFCSIVCTLVIVYFLMSISNRELDREYNHSVPYDPHKINLSGVYQPFYGYTIVAMIDPSLSAFAERIEEFLQSSSLAKSHSPLPASTYHMTIYSIYQCGNRMIPPVERWVNETGMTVSKSFWLPHEVLQEQNDKAMCIIEKYLTEPLYIKYVRLKVAEPNIKFILEIDDSGMERIRKARDEFSKIYEDPDLSMEPINKKLHISLGYIYAPLHTPNVKEWNKLNQLVVTFNGGKLMIPSVYLFDSMTNYIPYRKRNAC